MSDGHIPETDLQAYADGKLPSERRAAVEAWLAAHPEDAERIESYRRLAEELRNTYLPVLDEPVPDRLQRSLRPQKLRRAARVALHRDAQRPRQSRARRAFHRRAG